MLEKEELLNLISKALKTNKKKINPNLKLGDIEEWDSLGHLEILINIDKKTNGKASKIRNLSSCDSVKKIYTSLKKHNLIK